MTHSWMSCGTGRFSLSKMFTKIGLICAHVTPSDAGEGEEWGGTGDGLAAEQAQVASTRTEQMGWMHDAIRRESSTTATHVQGSVAGHSLFSLCVAKCGRVCVIISLVGGGQGDG